MQNHDKRTFSRLPINVELKGQVASGALDSAGPGQGRDFSEGGLRIVFEAHHAPGTVLDLALVLPDSYATLHAQTRVVWTDEINVAGHMSYDTGVAFISLTDAHRDRLRKLTGQPVSGEEDA